MAILENRVKKNNNLLNLFRFIIGLLRKLVFVILIAMSFALIYFFSLPVVSSFTLEATGSVLKAGNTAYNETAQTVQSIYSRFFYLKDLDSNNRKLKYDLARLQQEYNKILHIKSENLALKELLNVPKEEDKKYVTAKVVSIAINPISSYITVQAGTNHNVHVNDIVTGKRGLVGRVTEVSANYANIMLVNDTNSRIPVITANSKQVGVLAKMGNKMRLIYFQDHLNLEEGELILTSGDGKIFPHGIPVAKVTKIKNRKISLELLEDLTTIEFLTIESKINQDESDNKLGTIENVI